MLHFKSSLFKSKIPHRERGRDGERVREIEIGTVSTKLFENESKLKFAVQIHKQIIIIIKFVLLEFQATFG